MKGQCTAELRRVWGLNEVLRTDGLNHKNRDDHRHHAVDALVIALTSRTYLQQLAKVFKIKEERPRLAPGQEVLKWVFPVPWPSFRDDVQARVDTIYVSHRASRKIAGALHEDTLYGRTSKPERATGAARPHAKDWVENEHEFVVCKPLESLTAAEVLKVRDLRVKELILERLAAFGIDPEVKGSKIGKEVWKEPLRMVGRRGAEKSPNAPIIRKVRVTKLDETIQPIRQGPRVAYVKPGNTHHIEIYELPGSTPEKPMRLMKAVTMLEAAQRAKAGQPLIGKVHPDEPTARFLFSLSQGEMVLGKFGGKKHERRPALYRFNSAASTSKQMWFVLHIDARASKERGTDPSAKPSTMDFEKVQVDVLGRIRRARD